MLKQSLHLRSKQDHFFSSVPLDVCHFFSIYASDNDIWFCAVSLEKDARMISLEEELQQFKEEMERMKAKSNVSPISTLPFHPHLSILSISARLSIHIQLPFL